VINIWGFDMQRIVAENPAGQPFSVEDKDNLSTACEICI
jgi:hypothetical protein